MALFKRSRVASLFAGVVLLLVLMRWAHSPPPLAEVAPAAVCGNKRCEIGEKTVIRITPEGVPQISYWSDPSSKNISFGRSVFSVGDTDGDGVSDIAVGGIRTGSNYGNLGVLWTISLNRDGTVKSMRGNAEPFGNYSNYLQSYGAAYAVLGQLNGQTVNAYNTVNPDDGQPIVRVGNDNNYATVGNFAAVSMANIGDINGDGFPELAVGRLDNLSFPATAYGVGTVSIVSIGSRNGFTIEGTTLHTIPADGDGFPTPNPPTIMGLLGFGKSIAALGDMNGDGKMEIAVGDSDSAGEYSGSVWILSLNSDGSVASKSKITPGESFAAGNEAGYFPGFGGGVANIGDWDGDSVPDLVIATDRFAHGDVSGQHDSPLWILNLNRNGTVKNTRVIHASEFGAFTSYVAGYPHGDAISLASIPDIDGDGKQEIVLGDPMNSNCNGTNTYLGTQGAVLLLLSKYIDSCSKDCNWCPPPADAAMSQGSAIAPPDGNTLPTCNDGTCDIGEWNPVNIPGPMTYSPYNYRLLNMGQAALADMGDFDGNGAPDIAVAGTRTGYVPPNSQGEVALIFLNRNGSQKSVRQIYEGTGGLLTGRDSATRIGAALAALGDLNNDGVKDIAVTSSLSYPNTRSIFILFLNANGTVKSWRELTSQDIGADTKAFLGEALAPLGDFDGDGIPDLAVGEPGLRTSEATGGGTEEGRVHLLFFNRDGSIKSKKTFFSSQLWGRCASDDSSCTLQRRLLGSPMAYFGDLFHDGRRLLVAGNVMMFLNADASLNSLTKFTMRPFGLANVGDQNGDGRADIAIVSTGHNYSFPEAGHPLSGDGQIFYYSISSNGGLTYLTAYYVPNMIGSNSAEYVLSGRFMTSVADMDGDNRRELVFSDDSSGYCGDGSSGNAWMVLSGKVQNICSNDCGSVNVCSGSFGVTGTSSSSSSSIPSSLGVPSVSSSSSSRSSSGAGSSASQESSSPSVVSSASTSSQSCSSASSGGSATTASSMSTVSDQASSSSSAAGITGFASSSTSFFSSSTQSSFAEQVTSSSVASQKNISSSAVQYAASRCGDGVLNAGEACDTGHPCPAGGFCTVQCQCRSTAQSSQTEEVASALARCGNGILETGEQCDSGIPCPNQEFCTSACSCRDRSETAALCGNDVLNAREECDDGNVIDGDGCSALCIQETMEQQDQISMPMCGNDVLEGAEQCELSVPCLRSGEFCQNCQCSGSNRPVCGNGTMESDEACETTVPCADPSFLCASCRCIPPVCGDGSKAPSEECDDGNTLDGDGCSAACTREIPTVVASEQLCGNGIVEQGEACDDGNRSDFDGCSASCTRETPTQESLNLSLITEESPVTVTVTAPSTPVPPPTPVAGPTPKKAPSSALSVPTPPLRPVAASSVAPVPSFPVAAQTTLQVAQYPAYWQSVPSLPYAPPSGPVGKTGPASLAIMVSGAAAGFALMRRKRR